MAARKRSARTRSIRLTLAGLLVVPLISLAGLWAFAASVTLGPALQEHNYNRQYGTVGRPAQTLGVQLGQERLQSFIWLSSGRRESPAQLATQRQRTDAAVSATRAGAQAAQGVLYSTARAPLAKFLRQVGQLAGIRALVDSGRISAQAAFQAYSSIIDTEYQFYAGAVSVPDTTLYRNSVASVQAGYALELTGREAALVGGAFAAGDRMSRAEHQLFAQTVANQRYVIGQALADLSPDLRAPYAQAYATPAYSSFQAMENRIADSPVGNAPAPVPVSAGAWQSASKSFIGAFTEATNSEALELTQGGSQLGNRLLLRLVLAGGVGLIAVALSVFLLLRFSRRLIRELTGLREAARTLADQRLPRVVDRLRRGEDVDVAAEAPPFAFGRTTEIAAVAQAFSTVQRTATQAAVGQAELRKGVSQVFLNLARRNQSLLHRQLNTLDAMERRASEPEALSELFRLDHLTTRMRRYAESLIILSGNPPGRGWSKPVSAIDVLRAAVAEVEDYTRVDVACDSREAVAGAAVADVIHMLAELVENAATFSPPNTKVQVRGETVGKGFAVEIEDRGLGIDPENLQAINERLESRPEFDLAASDQLGLFVVGQLAARHGIRVSLRPSPYGGTTAIVLMPHAIMAAADELSAAPGHAEDGPPSAAEVAGDAPAGTEAAMTSGAAAQPSGMPADQAMDPYPAGPSGHWAEPAAGSSGGWPSWSLGEHQLADPESSAAAATSPAGGQDSRSAPIPAPAEWQPAPEPGPASWPAPPAEPSPGPSPEPPPAEPSAGDAGPGNMPAAAGTHMGLPRRQRKASLAPGLRDQPPASGTGAPDIGERSPEEIRALMASMQRGWQRGRADADDLGYGTADDSLADARSAGADEDAEGGIG